MLACKLLYAYPDSCVFSQAVLHRWRRELYELLPYLRATDVKSGWLYKRGETSSVGFKKRYCVLFSSYRLLYFDSEACTKRKGAVDLSVAESVDLVSTSKGHGFGISTPGRTFVFAAEDPEEQLSWTSSLRTMLDDIHERKKRQQVQEGVTILKEGWADLKDETQDGEGSWLGHWFALNSSGELRVYPDAESTEEQVVALVDLKHVERVERSKGMVRHALLSDSNEDLALPTQVQGACLLVPQATLASHRCVEILLPS